MRRVLLLTLLLLLGAGAFAFWSLRPPAPLASPPRGAVLDDVRVVNPATGGSTPDLRVEGGAIAAIEAASRTGTPSLAGHTVLPGLIDMHVHFPAAQRPRPDRALRVPLPAARGDDRARRGHVDGAPPRPPATACARGAFQAWRVFGRGYFVDVPSRSGRTRSWWTRRTRAQRCSVAAEGFDCVKAYDRLSADALAARRSREDGLPVIGHAAQRNLPRRPPRRRAAPDRRRPRAGDLRPFPEVLDGPPLGEAELAELARRAPSSASPTRPPASRPSASSGRVTSRRRGGRRARSSCRGCIAT